MNPHLEWLVRRWGLPAEGAASAAVERLLNAEASGSTAFRLQQPVEDWGKAVGGDFSPLVLVNFGESQLIQSRGLFTAEQFLAKELVRLASVELPNPPDTMLLQRLFPQTVPDDPQRRAVHVALGRQLAVVTGGPGTGKTYTLARILAALTETGIREIRLAAPTGKAADRMKSAVSDSLEHLPRAFPADRDIVNAAATSSTTLHSLLGFYPETGRCRFHQDNPLSCEALIVDECSMVDVYLWQALLKALPPTARLILLGDPDQLESVGKGHVFGALTRSAKNSASALHPCCVHLTEARRFRDRPGIRPFAEAMVAAEGAKAVSLLQDSEQKQTGGLGWIPVRQPAWSFADFPLEIREGLEEIAMAGSPAEALSALGRVCILTPQRQFFTGSLALGDAIAGHLARTSDGLVNQPIIINRNDPETGLRNGTVGIIMGKIPGVRTAYFSDASESLREIPVFRLPDFSPAWALTIHRSQGSEYRDVLVFLPQQDSPMATRELLYTAITRARQSVTVVGDLAAVSKAASTPSRRTTLLDYHLARDHKEIEAIALNEQAGKAQANKSDSGK